MDSSQKQEQVVNGLVTKSPGELYSVLDMHNAGHCSSSYLHGLLILSSLGWLNHQPAYGRRTQDYRTWTESSHLFVCHCRNHNILLLSKIGQTDQIHLKITCLPPPPKFPLPKGTSRISWPSSTDNPSPPYFCHLVCQVISVSSCKMGSEAKAEICAIRNYTYWLVINNG